MYVSYNFDIITKTADIEKSFFHRTLIVLIDQSFADSESKPNTN